MSIITESKIKNNFAMCILYILNLLIIFFASSSLSSLANFEKIISSNIEENGRKSMEENIVAIKDSITFYVSENDLPVTEDREVTNYLYNWYHQAISHSLFKTDSETILYSVGSTQLLWHVNNNSFDIENLIFYSNNTNEGISFDKLVHIFRDSSVLDKYYFKDENGKKYWIEWGYSPNPIRGYDNKEYVINGELNEGVQGIFILNIKSQDEVFSTYTKSSDILNLVEVFVPILIILSFITSIIMMFYIAISQRRIEWEISNLSLYNK